MCTKDRDAVGARWSRTPTRHSSFAGDSSNPRSQPRGGLPGGAAAEQRDAVSPPV